MEETRKIYLMPGQIFYSDKRYIVETLLGSCISVCLYDRFLKTGGMTHFIHPLGIKVDEQNPRYGNYSTRRLIEMMYSKGSAAQNIEASVIGGAQSRIMTARLGDMNRDVAKKILWEESIDIVFEDTGGYNGRKVFFDSFTGKIKIQLI